MSIIALDLGGTKLAGALFNKEGKILSRQTAFLGKRKGKEVASLIVEMAKSLEGESEKKVESLGICVPGIAHANTGTVWAPNIPGWEDYPLQKELKQEFSKRNINVRIDSDRACCILGEIWQGNAKGSKDAIYLAVGTGIGAGILAGGQVLRGAHDIAGAIGWLAFNHPYEEKYRQCGGFEYHASGAGLAKVAAEMLHSGKFNESILKTAKAISGKDIFEGYERGDPLAVAVIENAIVHWGMAVANLVSLFNPEKIILGGGVFGPAVKFIDRIKQESTKWAQPISMKKVRIEASALGTDAGLYGAAFLSIKNEKFV